jgi:NitT/TauT family transport system substrate-binding protein
MKVPNAWRRVARLLAVAALSLIAGPALAQPIPITVSVGVRDPIYTHLYVALAKGFLKEEGLDPKLVVTGSGSRSAQLLATGQADVLLGNPEHIIVISREGRPTAMLAAVDQRNTFGNILVRSESKAKSIADLKGTQIGVTATGGGAYYYGNYLLLRNGLKPGDATWLSLGSVANLQGALKSGRVESVMASLSMIETAQKEGYGRVLFDSRDDAAWNRQFGGAMPSSVVYALTDTIDKKKDAMRRFVRGIVKADDWIKKSSPDEIAAAIAPEMGGQPAASLAAAIKEYKETYWRPQGLRISKDEFARWQEFVVENDLVPKSDLPKYDFGTLVKDVGAF